MSFRGAPRATAAVLVVLTLSIAGPAHALQVHLRDIVFVDGSAVTIGEVATLSGGTQAEREAVAGTPLVAPVTRPTLLPARWIRASLADPGAEPVAVSGRRVVVVPSAGLDGRAKLFFERLLRAIDAQEPRGDARIEVALLATTGVEPGRVGPDLSFSTGALGRRAGYPAGEGSLGFTTGGATGSARVWIHTFLPFDTMTPPLLAGAEVDLSTLAGKVPGLAAPAAAGGSVVRAGDPVTVVFQRGGISIAVPGRAQGTGGLSDTLAVRAGDSRRLYSGVVTGPAEVMVDVP